MSNDYIPHADLEYRRWLDRFVNGVTAHAAELGLTPQQVAALQQQRSDFDSAFAEMQQAKILLNSATKHKNSERRSSERAMRAMARRISDLPALTAGMRGEMGLTIPDKTRTHLHVGDERPVIYLETVPGAVIVHFGTRPTNERFNSKPKWAIGCNIHRKKVGEAKWQLLALETTSPYVDRVDGPGADYTYVVEYRGKKASQVGKCSLDQTVAARGAFAERSA